MTVEDRPAPTAVLPGLGAREWIASRRCPAVAGPGPLATLLWALLGANAALIWFPSAEGFLAIAGLLFALAIAVAFMLRSEATYMDAAAVATLAAIAFGWACWIEIGFAAQPPILHNAALVAAALVLGYARRLQAFTHAWSEISAEVADWKEQDLSDYGEFLLGQKPCPGAARIARELYRQAAAKALGRALPTTQHVAAVRRLADLLGSGTGGKIDPAGARWWRDRAAELERHAISIGDAAGAVATECGPGRTRAGGSDPGAGTPAGPQPGGLEQGRNIPVFRAPVHDPAGLAECGMTIAFRPFLLPQGGLLACLIRFHDDPDEPSIVHRVFDLLDDDEEAFLAASEHHLRWRLELLRGTNGGGGADSDAPGSAQDGTGRRTKVVLEVSLEGAGLMEAFEAVIGHNGRLGAQLDTAAALHFVMSRLSGVSDHTGLDAAWAAIERACARSIR
jgi:hypothetical protein